MKILGLFDITRGRLLLPLRATISSAGEMAVSVLNVFIRANDLAVTLLRVLTDRDINTTVAPLVNGTVPLVNMPPAVVDLIGGSGLTGSLAGEIRMWSGDPHLLPSDWLPCDGQEIPQAAPYARLFAVVGHRYGRAANAANFRLPNFTGRTPVGAASALQMLAAGAVIRKINVNNPGDQYNDGVYTVALTTNGPGAVVGSVTVTIVDQQVISIALAGTLPVTATIVPGSVTFGLGISNCNIVIPVGAMGGNGLCSYEIVVSPTTSANLGWGIKLDVRGVGYTSPPLVTITNGPVGATAIAIVNGGTVRAIVVTNPGLGSADLAIIGFTGGAPSTPAAATVEVWTTAITTGDLLGEQHHKPLVEELVVHTHGIVNTPNSFRQRDGGSGIQDSASGKSAGGGVFAPYMQPSIGVLFIVYAGA